MNSKLLDCSLESLPKYCGEFTHIIALSWWQAYVQCWPLVLQGQAFCPLSLRHMPLQEHTVMSSLFGNCVACSNSNRSTSSKLKLSFTFMMMHARKEKRSNIDIAICHVILISCNVNNATCAKNMRRTDFTCSLTGKVNFKA